MVKALSGKVDGVAVSFTQNDQGRWVTAVPAADDGVYIIEVWAEDHAGNIGYFATIKFTYDTTQLCMAVEILEVGAAFTMEEVLSVLQGDGVSTVTLMTEACSSVVGESVNAEVVECEVCGR